ncbi:MAG: DUF2163 domain-containing protein [Alphaproteobacteria bacterium]|nr:DUF2163 domain-containing protein [Alphaproteobacteria bacterium]
MTRPIPAPLLGVLEGSPLSGECVILQARDGTVIGFTTLDEPQVVDLTASGGPGPVTCAEGMLLSALTLVAGLDASHCELQGPLGEVGEGASGLTRGAVEGGRWADAEAWLVRVSPGEAGYAPLLYGKARESRVEDPRFVLEIRGDGDIFNQVLEQLITPYCRLRFGVGQCPGVPVTAAATVVTVTDPMRFTVSYAGSFADGFFNAGEAAFTSGALVGVISENLYQWNETAPGTAAIELMLPLIEAPAPGDTLTISQGCPKTRPACVTLLGDAAPMQAFPDVPGEDVLLYPTGTGT